MTEGPTARLRAIQIKERFQGEEVLDIFTRSKKLFTDPRDLIGLRLDRTDSYGKNILLFLGEYAIRIHLMMFGSIRFENNYSKPFQRVRLYIGFSSGKLVVYNAPIVEIDFAESIEKRLSESLGVDPLRNWNKELLLEMLSNEGNRLVGDVLLDQKIFAGVGNILRNEILHRAGIRPGRKVNEISREEKMKLVEYCKKLSEDFLEEKIKSGRIGNILMVYNRKRCGKCGDKIIFYRDKITSRKTFYCPICQK